MVSKDAGEYNLTNAAPGPYTITAELAGFKKYEQKDIQLRARQVLRVDIRLELGAIAETVTVNVPVSTVNTETVTISESISPTKLKYNPWQLANRAMLSTLAWQTVAAMET
jgi:hypothetical protein